MLNQGQYTAKTSGIESKSRPRQTNSKTQTTQDQDWKKGEDQQALGACVDFWRKASNWVAIALTLLVKRKDELVQWLVAFEEWWPITIKLHRDMIALFLKSPPIHYVSDVKTKAKGCWGRDKTMWMCNKATWISWLFRHNRTTRFMLPRAISCGSHRILFSFCYWGR